ncbi:hypothetical protein [Nesterenkonia suensis]
MRIEHDTNDAGQEWLRITRDTGTAHLIPLEALSSWGELLGITDALDTIEAIIGSQARGGEPAPDMWDAPYRAVARVERAREREAARALIEGKADDPRSPELRAAFRAREMLGEQRADQQRARDLLGVPTPARDPSAVRGACLSCEVDPQDTGDRERLLSHEDREELRAVVAPHLPAIEDRRRRFCHTLTGHRIDPLRHAGYHMTPGNPGSWERKHQ